MLIRFIPKIIRKLRLFQKSGLAKTGSVITILVIYIPWLWFLLYFSIGGEDPNYIARTPAAIIRSLKYDDSVSFQVKFFFMSWLFTFLVYLLFLCFLDIKKLFVNAEIE